SRLSTLLDTRRQPSAMHLFASELLPAVLRRRTPQPRLRSRPSVPLPPPHPWPAETRLRCAALRRPGIPVRESVRVPVAGRSRRGKGIPPSAIVPAQNAPSPGLLLLSHYVGIRTRYPAIRTCGIRAGAGQDEAVPLVFSTLSCRRSIRNSIVKDRGRTESEWSCPEKSCLRANELFSI